MTILLLFAFGWMVAFIITRGFGYRVQNPEIGLGYALLRTSRLNAFITKVTEKGRRFWRFLFDLGIVTSIGLMVIAVLLLAANIPAFFIRTEESPAVGVAPVIPGITVSFSSLPYFLIAIAVGAAAHELCHGIAALNEKVTLKSTGIFIFLFFFGAFVEPKEESLKSKSRRSRLRIFAAGGLANIIITYSFLFLLMIPMAFPMTFVWGFETTPSGVLITDVVEDSPADQAGIQSDWVIQKVTTPNQSSEIILVRNTEDFRNALSDVKINDSVELWFKDHNRISLVADSLGQDDDADDQGYIGVRYFDFYKPILPLPRSLPFHFYVIIVYIVLVNLMLALFNLLPIPLLDGDKMVATLLESKGEQGKQLHKWIRIMAFAILAINMALTFLTGGWVPL
ncbi:MAG: site-2 protease family protein [Candidatus Hodarchaeales archaeon]|jgi:membrane-associated protease RseP (regulator of RpoE activity)